ncbi:MAG: hypothetical protein AB7P50_11175 [Alphaproteobacteria bacterium]
MSNKLKVRARIAGGDTAREIVASGQEAKALLALAEAGARGVTALECAAWAYRLAAYAHSLRKRFGLVIVTLHEAHPGGWHGRHVLETAVEILEVMEAGSCSTAA